MAIHKHLRPWTLIVLLFPLVASCSGPAQEAREAPTATPEHKVDPPRAVLRPPQNEVKKIHGNTVGEDFTADLRMIYTRGGFGWRTTDSDQETACNMCRAGTPIVLANRPRDPQGQTDRCDLEMMTLRGNIAGLLEQLLDSRREHRAISVRFAAPWIEPDHSRVIHGLMTHPRDEVRGAALNLAGKAQMNMFLPELSRACREGAPQEKSGAIAGVHALKSLGGQTLSREFPADQSADSLSIRPAHLDKRCPGPARFQPGATDHSISSLALGAYAYGQSVQSNHETVESAPAIIQFAYGASREAFKGNAEGLKRHREALHTLLTKGQGCATHPCDWLLLDRLDASLLSLSPAKR